MYTIHTCKDIANNKMQKREDYFKATYNGTQSLCALPEI